MVACDVCNGEKSKTGRQFYCVLGRRFLVFLCMWHVHANGLVSAGIRELDENH